MLNKITTHAAAVVLGAVACFAMLHRTQQPQPVTTTMATSAASAVTESVTTVTKKPDGNVVIEKKTRKTEERKAQNTAVASATPVKGSYRVGITADIRSLTERPEMGVYVGKRLFGDVWATVGTTERMNEITIGVGVDF